MLRGASPPSLPPPPHPPTTPDPTCLFALPCPPRVQVPGAGVRGVCEVAGGAAYRVSFGSAAFVRQALPAGFHLPVQQPQPQPQPLEQPALDDVDGAALQQQLQGQGLGLGLEVGPKASAVLVAVRLTADEAAGAAAVGKGAPGAIAAGTHGAGEGGRSRRRRSSSSSGDDSGTSSVGSAGLGGWPSPRSLLGLEQQQGSGKRRRRLPAKGGPIHSLLPPAGQGAGCCSCCGKGRMLGAAAQAVTVALLEFSDDVQLGAALALQQLAEGSWQGGAPRPSATKRLVMLTGAWPAGGLVLCRLQPLWPFLLFLLFNSGVARARGATPLFHCSLFTVS